MVRQAYQERNFHVFYYLYCGLDDEDQAKYCLGNPSDKRYILVLCDKSIVVLPRAHQNRCWYLFS